MSKAGKGPLLPRGPQARWKNLGPPGRIWGRREDWRSQWVTQSAERLAGPAGGTCARPGKAWRHSSGKGSRAPWAPHFLTLCHPVPVCVLPLEVGVDVLREGCGHGQGVLGAQDHGGGPTGDAWHGRKESRVPQLLLAATGPQPRRRVPPRPPPGRRGPTQGWQLLRLAGREEAALSQGGGALGGGQSGQWGRAEGAGLGEKERSATGAPRAPCPPSSAGQESIQPPDLAGGEPSALGLSRGVPVPSPITAGPLSTDPCSQDAPRWHQGAKGRQEGLQRAQGWAFGLSGHRWCLPGGFPSVSVLGRAAGRPHLHARQEAAALTVSPPRLLADMAEGLLERVRRTGAAVGGQACGAEGGKAAAGQKKGVTEGEQQTGCPLPTQSGSSFLAARESLPRPLPQAAVPTSPRLPQWKAVPLANRVCECCSSFHKCQDLHPEHEGAESCCCCSSLPSAQGLNPGCGGSALQGTAPPRRNGQA